MGWYGYLLGTLVLIIVFLSILGIAAVRAGAISDSSSAINDKSNVTESNTNVLKKNANKRISQRDNKESS